MLRPPLITAYIDWAGGELAGRGTRGPELHPAPRPLQGPGLSSQPSGPLRPRSCLALPHLPRLKLINGSAIATAIGCKPYQRGTSIFAQNKRRTEARAAATRLWWGRGGWRSLELTQLSLRTLRSATGEASAAGVQLRGPHARHGLGQRASGQAPPLGDNQRSHLNAFRSARGEEEPRPRVAQRAPGPAPAPPGLLSSSAPVMGYCEGVGGVLLHSPGPSSQSAGFR